MLLRHVEKRKRNPILSSAYIMQYEEILSVFMLWVIYFGLFIIFSNI